jgi:putative hydrolase of the HAD superfamily
MKPRAIIFDLFHTLISVKTDGFSAPSTAAILGIPEARWNTLIFEQSEDRLCGRMTDPIQIIGQLAEIAGVEVPPEKIARAARTRQMRFEASLEAVQTHVLETLDRIRQAGALTALCSNADCLERKGWDKSPLKGRFDATVFSCDVGCMKPQKEIYQICLDRLEVRADETLFVGDGGSNELTGAKAVGIKTVLTTEIISRRWPEVVAQRKQDADYVITNVEQILEYL